MRPFKKSGAIKPFTEMAGKRIKNSETPHRKSLSSGDTDYVENPAPSETPHFSRYAAVISR